MSSAPLRVLSIAHAAVSRAAGRRRYYPLTAERRFDIHLVGPARWREYGREMTADPPDEPGLSMHVMPILFPSAGPFKWHLHVYPGLRRLIRDIRPHVIHLWEEPWSAVALQASLLAGDAGLALEVDQNILKRLPPPFEAIRAHVLRRADHILSRSPEATAVVRAKGYAGPATPIGYGVDRDIFHPPAEPRARTEGSPLRIGYVGRLVEEKGLDDALDALARSRAPVSLAIMGGGPDEERLRARVAALGLNERVSMRGWASPTEVADFMRGLDVVILLTRTTKAVREQFGRVIIEAQSCGAPVIGSACGAIPSVVGAGGWIVPERDPATLAALLDALAGEPDQLRARAVAAEQNVVERFTFDAVAAALATSWTEAAARRAMRRAEAASNAKAASAIAPLNTEV